MGLTQILLEDKIATVEKLSATQLQLPVHFTGQTAIRVAGKQILEDSPLVMDTTVVGLGGRDNVAAITANTFYYLYAAVLNGVYGLIISLNGPATGPAGVDSYSLIGDAFTNRLISIFPNDGTLIEVDSSGAIALTVPGVVIPLNTPGRDPFSLNDTAAYTITLPLSGIYSIGMLSTISGGPCWNYRTIRKNGGGWWGFPFRQNLAGPDSDYIQKEDSFNAGDYLDVYESQDGNVGSASVVLRVKKIG